MDTSIVDEIRSLIRQGWKTSEIVYKKGYPLDIVKAIKSEELENDKHLAREKGKADQQTYMAGKQERAHQAFLKRIGQADGAVQENTQSEG